MVDSMPFELCEEFDKLNLRIVANTEAMEVEVGSSLLQEIRKGQVEDENIYGIKRNIKKMRKEYYGTKEGLLCRTTRSIMVQRKDCCAEQ
jgi:hypothetical protein